jgi:hypothetical protein
MIRSSYVMRTSFLVAHQSRHILEISELGLVEVASERDIDSDRRWQYSQVRLPP